MHRNLNAPRHGIAALLLGLQLQRCANICTHYARRRGLVEGSQISTSISGFSRRTTAFCTDLFPAYCVLPLQDLAITALSPCRVIRETKPRTTWLRQHLILPACRPQINAVKRAGAAWIPQTHHEQFPIRGALHQPSSSRAAGLGPLAHFVFQPLSNRPLGMRQGQASNATPRRLNRHLILAFSSPPLSLSVHLQLHRSPCPTTSSAHDNS